MVDSDELMFEDDVELPIADDESGEVPTEEAWKVLLVDDEPDVHAVTRMALSGLLVDSRPVEIVSASSRHEAERVLAAHDDIALAVLDVVMEGEDTGLIIAEHIRRTYKDRSIRIVLRTGQAGLAPEEQILNDYDINDYWPKTELSVRRMRTLVTGNIRSCRDLRLLESYSRELEQRNLELHTLKEDLEHLVEERTYALRRATQQLEDINSQLAQKNEILSITAARDSLTGLINHGTFVSRLDQILALFPTEPVGLILLDIDYFKSFNDENGHLAGDDALRAVARLLENSVRDNDFAARIGGEEFVLVLRGCDLDKALGVAERARHAIGEIRLEAFPNRAITASFGVSVSKPGEGREALVQRADEAMYVSKSRGRNCVTSQAN